MPAPGYLSNIAVYAFGAGSNPPRANDLTFAVLVNETATPITLTLPLSSRGETLLYTGVPVPVAAGDIVGVQLANIGGTIVDFFVTVSITYASTPTVV